jgi:hypothetical protein
VTEAELRAVVVPLAHQHGWLVFSMPAARLRRPVKDATGYPDLTLARDGRVMWMELKQDDGVLSPAQMRWLRVLPAMHVIRPADLAAGVVDTLLR